MKGRRTQITIIPLNKVSVDKNIHIYRYICLFQYIHTKRTMPTNPQETSLSPLHLLEQWRAHLNISSSARHDEQFETRTHCTTPFQSHTTKLSKQEQTMSRSKLPFVFFSLLFLLHNPHFSNANQPIQAIVVLVLENRSFDHMLGWLKKNDSSTIDGLTGRECNRRSTSDPNSPSLCVSDDAQYVDPDPGHSFEVSLRIIFLILSIIIGSGQIMKTTL